MSHPTQATNASDLSTHYYPVIGDLSTENFSSNIFIDSSTLSPTFATNVSAAIVTSLQLPEAVRVFLSLTAVCIAVLAVICNTLLVLAIVRSRALQTPTNLFLSSLAAGETIFAVFGVPLAAASVLAGRWPFSEQTCCVSGALQSIGRSSSTFSLMAVCLDRCLAVSRPLKYSHLLTLQTSGFILVILWLLAVVMALLPIDRVWGRYAYDHAHFMCILVADPEDGDQSLIREVVCSFVPAAVILLSLLQILRDVRSHHRIFSVVPVPVAATSSNAGEVGVGTTRDTGDGIPSLVVPLGPRSFNRNTLRAMRSLFVVTLGYALFCLPADFVNAFHQEAANSGSAVSVEEWEKEEAMEEMGRALEETDKEEDKDALIAWERCTTLQACCVKHYVTAIVWLSFLCCVLNPLVIIVFNRKFRTELKAMFSRLNLYRKLRPSKEVFTISTGLHSILEATLVLNMVKKEQASTITSTRRQVFRSSQVQ